MEELHDDAQASPVWAIFSDLMAALVGILVLVLVWVIGIQLELSQSLEQEKEKRLAEEQRRSQQYEMQQRLSEPRSTLVFGFWWHWVFSQSEVIDVFGFSL